jgi:TM2 domain-containing membrane protein YozV
MQKSKTLSTWLAFLGGSLGLHRFYLHGFTDGWGWLSPLPTLVGAFGLLRLRDAGLDDTLGAMLVPLLGLMLVAGMLQAILIGLTPDDRWHQRFNAEALPSSPVASSGWLNVLGIALSLMIGATILMSTIAFAGQRYFEHQIEEAQKLSQ